MAKWKKTAYEEKDLTIYTASGELHLEETLEAVKEFYSDTITEKLVWDFSNADISAITREDVEHITQTALQHAHRRPSGRTALVMSPGASFGMGRMYGLLCENREQPVSYGVFANLQEALQWLDVPLPLSPQ